MSSKPEDRQSQEERVPGEGIPPFIAEEWLPGKLEKEKLESEASPPQDSGL